MMDFESAPEEVDFYEEHAIALHILQKLVEMVDETTLTKLHPTRKEMEKYLPIGK